MYKRTISLFLSFVLLFFPATPICASAVDPSGLVQDGGIAITDHTVETVLTPSPVEAYQTYEVTFPTNFSSTNSAASVKSFILQQCTQIDSEIIAG